MKTKQIVVTNEVINLIQGFLRSDGIEFFRELKEKHGEVSPVYMEHGIPHAVHFREGMQIRNFFRSLDFFKDWDCHMLDDNWAQIIEAIVVGKSEVIIEVSYRDFVTEAYSSEDLNTAIISIASAFEKEGEKYLRVDVNDHHVLISREQAKKFFNLIEPIEKLQVRAEQVTETLTGVRYIDPKAIETEDDGSTTIVIEI